MDALKNDNALFISYSRQNSAFSQQIVQALKDRKIGVWYDQEDIPKGMKWWEEIKKGITDAQAFIFIVSPDSLQSQVCNWELAFALEHKKKIIPIIYLDPTGDTSLLATLQTLEWRNLENQPIKASQNWEQLRQINFVFLTPQHDFETGLAELIQAAQEDIGHGEQHTSLLQRATQWESNQFARGYLLSREQLWAAEEWLTEGIGKNPLPSALHMQYIDASRKEQNRLQRVILSSVSVALVVVSVLAVVAWLLFGQSQDRLSLANTRGTQAVAESQRRATSQAEAEANLLDSWNSQARFLADAALQAQAEGYQQRSLSLALTSLANYPQVFNTTSYTALINALNMPLVEQFAFSQKWVYEMPFSPDQRYLLTTGWLDQSIQIRDVQTGTLRLNLVHPGITAATWSRSGEQILSWSNTTVRLWQVNSGALVAEIVEPEGFAELTWSHDETTVLTSGRQLKQWDLATGSLVQSIPLACGQWNTAQTYAAGWQAKDFILWNLQTNVAAFTWPQQGNCDFLLWSPDDQKIVTWDGAEMHVDLWNVITGQHIKSLQLGFTEMVWSPDSNRVTGYNSMGDLVVIDANTGAILSSMKHQDRIWEAVWDQASERLLARSRDGLVQVWDAASGAELLRLDHGLQFADRLDNVIGTARWNQDESLILTTSDDGWLRLWDAETGLVQAQFRHNAGFNRAVWSPDEQMLIATSYDGIVHGIAPPQTESLAEITHTQMEVEDAYVWGATMNADETYLLAWLTDETARVWEIGTGHTLLTLPHEIGVNYALQGASWNVAEDKILTWNFDGTVNIWEAESGKLLLKMRHGDGFRTTVVAGAAWNQAGDQVLSYADDNTVILWDAQTGAKRQMWQLDSIVHYAAWNTQEDAILICADHQAVIWDTATAQTIISEDYAPSSSLNGCEWGPDGQQALFWSWNGGYWLVDRATGRVLLAEPESDHDPFDTQAVLKAWGGERLYLQQGTHPIKVIEVTSGQIVQEISSPIEPQSMLVNAASTHLLLYDRQQLVLLEIATGQVLYTLKHPDIHQVRWGNNDQYVLAWDTFSEMGENDGSTVYVWNLSAPQPLVPIILEHPQVVTAAWWSADYQHVFTVSRGVNIWLTDILRLTAMGQAQQSLSLTNEEMATVFLPTYQPSVTPTATMTPLQVEPAPSAAFPDLMPSTTPTVTPFVLNGHTPATVMKALINRGILAGDVELIEQVETLSLEITPEQQINWQLLNGSFDDLVMGSTLRWSDTADEEKCGFVLRVSADANYLVMVQISRFDGVEFYQRVDGDWQLPQRGEMTALRVGRGETNDLVVVLQGQTLHFFLNGQRALLVENVDLAVGWAGISGQTVTNRATCEFSDLWIGRTGTG